MDFRLRPITSLLIFCARFVATQMGTIQSAIIVVPPQFDEIQVLTLADVLRRAEIQVTLAALGNSSQEVQGQHGLSIVADTILPTTADPMADLIVIPSGSQSYEFMIARSDLGAVLKSYAAAQKYVAALGTGVAVLATFSIYSGSQVTAYASVQSVASATYRVLDQNIVVDGPLFTARMTVNALPFALQLVEKGRSALLAREISYGLYSQTKLKLGVRGGDCALIRPQLFILAMKPILLIFNQLTH